MIAALPAAMTRAVLDAGYFPQTAMTSLQRSVRHAEVIAYLVRPETSFDGSEVRRHLTILALTSKHLHITHLDDDPADALNPSQVVATTDRVSLRRLRVTGLTQVHDTDGQRVRPAEAEVTLGMSWGGTRRIDLERGVCSDPECPADHGWSGSSTPADLALRVSALADGERAVEEAIAFYGALLDAIDAVED